MTTRYQLLAVDTTLDCPRSIILWSDHTITYGNTYNYPDFLCGVFSGKLIDEYGMEINYPALLAEIQSAVNKIPVEKRGHYQSLLS